MQTWVSRCGTYTVLIEDRFVDEALTLAKDHYPREVGTSLVGTYSDDGWDATVLHAAPLTTDSKAGRSWFQRGVRGLKTYFSAVFAKSSGVTHYVGEWHSHPDGAPIPSPTDDANMMEIVNDPETRCPECILVIVGYRSARARLGVYIYSAVRRRVDLNVVSVE